MSDIKTIEATQDHAILGVLINYCGQNLSGDLVEKIASDIRKEMRNGPCAWAFSKVTD